ncbi:MAG: hypothetical protein EPO61_03390 [Nitrospirae bacterium]|nr:MAG: hypothetical protein EPO61_03390 [Nitrospirota bacterium]
MTRFHGLALFVLLVGIVLPDGVASGSQARRNDTKPQSPASTGQKAHRPSGSATVRLPQIYSRQALRHLARKPFAQEHLLPRRAPVIRLPLRMAPAPAITLDPWKIRVIDGDTFAYGADRIRLRSIDTPEKDQSGGFEATQRLDALLHEGTVTMVTDALDPYGRTLADVYVNDRNVAEVLKNEGYAKPGSR